MPYVVEPSLGADRSPWPSSLTLMMKRWWARQEGRRRCAHSSAPASRPGPYKAAVLPLSKKLSGKGPKRSITNLQKDFMVDFDDTGSIGKRYRRQDEIGTPLCITVDFQTVGDETTPRRPLRHRPGSGHHGAGPIPIESLKAYIQEKMAF